MRIGTILLIILLSVSVITCQESENSKSGPVDLSNKQVKYSYAIGMDIGRSLRNQYVEPDIDVLMKGLKASLKSNEDVMTYSDVAKALKEFQTDQREVVIQKRAEEAAENKAAGEKFLAENKNKEGVKVTESGLQYKIITAGTGATPTAKDRVKVDYKGTFINGETFDSSYDRGEPAVFSVGGVIPGWTEGLQLMKVGAKWELYIPSDIAYGENGTRNMKPNQTLIFEVELLEIVK